jgi:phospholipase D
MRIVLPLILLAGLGASPALAAPAPAAVDTCFVPAERCVDRIVQAIDTARGSILVEAYGFTSRPIIAALVRAHADGIEVGTILDRSNTRGRASGLAALHTAGIPVWIDHVPGIAHIKALVIDGHLVIGGSYNFTASAESRNVEDVTFTDSTVVAGEFIRNWEYRRDQAQQD